MASCDAPTSAIAACPCCGHLSARVHSYYTRTLRDLPVAAQPVELTICARRFECRNDACPRKVFCERLGGGQFAKAYSRMSEQLIAAVRAIGFALNGEGGARLAKQLGICVSCDTILAVLRGTPHDEVTAPQVMGVDDWAYRKGQRYGTLIIDHEHGVPVDLIDGRTATDLAAWLTKHSAPTSAPRIITRDRSTEYTNAITQAWPEAQQIADRWHLLNNLRDVEGGPLCVEFRKANMQQSRTASRGRQSEAGCSCRRTGQH